MRWSGTDAAMIQLAKKNAAAIGAGHSFIVFLGDGFYPLNVLNTLKMVPEVCRIFCATANPTEVLLAKIETRFIPRDERHYRRLFSVIRAYLDDLDSGRFVFRPGLGCDRRTRTGRFAQAGCSDVISTPATSYFLALLETEL